MKIRKTIVNEETGQLIEDVVLDTSEKKGTINKKIVDTMLQDAKCIEDIDAKLLYEWCKITGEINNYGQIRLQGRHLDREFQKMMIEDMATHFYISKVFMTAHPFSGILMVNRQAHIKNWTELWEAVEITSSKIKARVKKFLLDNKALRIIKIIGKADNVDKIVFVINPFLFRDAIYSSQVSIFTFGDFAKEGTNINTYSFRYLQALGLL